eukprot:TRINITY_DN22924_c0_g2_i1.p1 TRINITY_DN22924_c0_g2~~TRINITY_DN22924_c0_g2_i1.p1  ORF type:complete len:459 (-),score=79.44 TRINITY_DN22924_c0_g2_i1:98-1474(-)
MSGAGAPKSFAPGGTSSSCGGASASSAAAGASEPTRTAKAATREAAAGAGGTPSPGNTEDGALSQLILGSVAKIAGLKAAPELNGELCQLLRLGEPGAGRVVVRTRLGEKALKPANIEVGFAVYPSWAKGLLAFMLAATVCIVGAVFATGGRHALACGVPALAAAWLLTLSIVLLRLYRPCKPSGSWVPGFSMLGANPPLSRCFRLGLIMVGCLFAFTVHLQSELVLDHLADVTQSMVEEIVANATRARELAAANDSVNSSMTGASSNTSSADVDTAGENSSAGSSPKRLNATEIYAALVDAPGNCVWWGYAASVGAVVQAVFTFERKLSIRSCMHCSGIVLFVFSLGHHASLTNFVLNSPRGAPLVGASPMLRTVWWLRDKLANYTPLALLAVPVASQLMNSMKGAGRHRGSQTIMDYLRDSGTVASVVFVQWAAVILFVMYYTTFSCDFHVGAQLL